jgi:hypothetical protein
LLSQFLIFGEEPSYAGVITAVLGGFATLLAAFGVLVARFLSHMRLRDGQFETMSREWQNRLDTVVGRCETTMASIGAKFDLTVRELDAKATAKTDAMMQLHKSSVEAMTGLTTVVGGMKEEFKDFKRDFHEFKEEQTRGPVR